MQHTTHNSFAAFTCLRRSRSALGTQEVWYDYWHPLSPCQPTLWKRQPLIFDRFCWLRARDRDGRLISIALGTWYPFFRRSFGRISYVYHGSSRTRMSIMARQGHDGAWRTAITTPVRRHKGQPSSPRRMIPPSIVYGHHVTGIQLPYP